MMERNDLSDALNTYRYNIQMDLEHLSAYEEVEDLEEKLEEIDEIYLQAAKADEYEAKAKAFDAILKAYYEAFAREHMADEVSNIIEKYESGEYDA